MYSYRYSQSRYADEISTCKLLCTIGRVMYVYTAVLVQYRYRYIHVAVAVYRIRTIQPVRVRLILSTCTLQVQLLYDASYIVSSISYYNTPTQYCKNVLVYIRSGKIMALGDSVKEESDL